MDILYRKDMSYLDRNSQNCVEVVPKKVIEDFLGWAKVHIMGIEMRHNAMGWEYDQGYIKAGEAMTAELKRLLEGDNDDRLEGADGFLE